MDKKPIELACDIVGGITTLANALGVKPPTVSQWISSNPMTSRRVPAARCPSIERATSGVVRCEDLRPDVEWSVLRGTSPRDQEAAHEETGPREHELQEVA